MNAVDAEFKRIFEKVRMHAGWGEAKTNYWFDTDNPNLGGISPRRMFKSGRGKKLEAWIDGCIDEAGDPKGLLKGSKNEQEETN